MTLTRGGARRERTTVTDGEGAFRFDAVSPGKFELTVAAHGMAGGSAGGTLLPGEVYQAPPITLAVATAQESIQVSIPRQEVAEEQVKAEERQRVIGIVPNYFVTYSRDPAPLDSKQKFNLGWHVILDPTNFLFSGVAAGIEQADNTFPGYRQGAQGFGKRYGAALANASLSTLLRGAVFPSLLRQDPRYYYKGTGTVGSRATYALATAVICKGDNGRWQPNYSSFLGNLSSGALSNLYYPASSRNGPALTFENGLLSIVGVGAGHLLQEFLFRRFTHNAPHAGTGP